MEARKLIIAFGALAMLGACGQTNDAGDAAKAETAPVVADADEAAATDEYVVDLTAAIAGRYEAEATHRYITFSYTHQGLSRPMLRWRDWSANLDWDPGNLDQSSVDVSIIVNSVDSGVDVYDGHLKSDKFFDAGVFPEITFVSTGFERTGANTGKLIGDLTIKGITKSVILDATINGARYDQQNDVHKLGFSAHGEVLRSDFGVDLYVPFVSDAVDIQIEAEFVSVSE